MIGIGSGRGSVAGGLDEGGPELGGRPPVLGLGAARPFEHRRE